MACLIRAFFRNPNAAQALTRLDLPSDTCCLCGVPVISKAHVLDAMVNTSFEHLNNLFSVNACDKEVYLNCEGKLLGIVSPDFDRPLCDSCFRELEKWANERLLRGCKEVHHLMNC